MASIVVFESVTLDGVMQAPGRPDEDTRDGFRYGGWATPYPDEVQARLAGQSMAAGGALLLGRRTYLDLFGAWHGRTDGNPFTPALDNSLKYVTSTTLQEPLPWINSILLAGDVPQAVARLRAQPGKDIVVLGSGRLVQTLRRHDLVDQYVLLIHPLVLGSGRRLFPDDSPYAALELVSATPTTTGVVIATYRPAGDRPHPSL